MNNRKLPLLFLVMGIFALSFGQKSALNNDGYSPLETQTEACLDLYLKKHDVEWKEITPVFENYFSSAGISDKNDSLEK